MSTPCARIARVTALSSTSPETFRVGRDLAADLLAVIGQRHELHAQARSVSAVEPPQRVQGLVIGERLALACQVGLGALAQHGQEQVVHAREVVVHQRGLHAGLGCTRRDVAAA